MPGIRVQDVREQARTLLHIWEQRPQLFLPRLEVLWESWGRPWAARGRQRPLPPHAGLRQYHVPEMVLLLVVQTWRTHARDRLLRDLAEALWGHPVLESRLLALRLWAITPQPQDMESFYARLLESRKIPPLREAVLHIWGRALAQTFPQAYLETWQKHMRAEPLQHADLVLRALLPLLEVPGLDLFPHIRPLLERLLTPPPEALLPEWRMVLERMFHRWPGEVLPWLRSLMRRAPSPAWRWLLARLLPGVEPRWKTRLRELIRESSGPEPNLSF